MTLSNTINGVVQRYDVTYCAVYMTHLSSMIGENRQFVTDEPVEFEK